MSSGLLYRYASYLVLKHKPKKKIPFLKIKFDSLKISKLKKLKLHTVEISENSAILAKEKKVREILKKYQTKFSKKNKRIIIEGRDIGTKILPKADIKFFFKCSLNVASRRGFKELKNKGSKIKLKDVKKALLIRNNLDKKRKNSPLIQSKNAVIVQTDKLKNIKNMVNMMTKVIEKKIKDKYGS